MLETPLYGKFVGENRRLVFGPTGPYQALVRACVVIGIVGAVLGLVTEPLGIQLPFYPAWWFFTGLAVTGAGVLAAFSLQIVVFDLKERTYRRRQGPGTFPKTSRGKFSDLDAIVLIAEPNSRLMAGGVTYHLVLHWKGMREPLMVLQQETRPVGSGLSLRDGASHLIPVGMRYAQALGVPFYDNSHFPSANPVPVWR
ncbi:MAG TPA: hypothetical protein VG944_11585 [Fimbriimonas sp.]|nr:hypothetical protein [Fimbriimonas sp.]